VTLARTRATVMNGPTMIRSNLLTCGGVLALSAVAVAACGGSTATGTTAPVASSQVTAPGVVTSTSNPIGGAASDSCKLVTPQEASTALGVDAGTPSSAAGQCAYTTATGTLTIIATRYPDSSTAQTSFDGTRTAAMGAVPGFQDVTGIGDNAFVTGSGLVEFAKASTVVIIQVLSGANPTAGTMTTLGQAAAGRV
jgi:hypothetical protein